MLMFECSGVVQHVDCSSPVVQHISHTYNVSISFKAPSRLYGNTAIVRGNQNNSSGVKVRHEVIDIQMNAAIERYLIV